MLYNMLMENYQIIISFILGLFVCLFGYKLKKVVFFIAWFLIGYTLMLKLLPIINSNAPVIAESTIYQTLLPIGGGVILSLLGFSIEKFCVSLLVCFSTIAIGISQFGMSWEVAGISAVIGVILGAFAVRLMKPATIIVTAAAGSMVVTNALLALVTSIPHEPYYIFILIGVAIIGALFQFKNTKHIL